MVRGVGFRGRRLGFGRPLGFDDVMTIEEIEPPSPPEAGHARIVKSGKLIRGAVTLTVSPRGLGSAILWRQDFGLARFPAAVGLAAARIAPLAYRATLRRLLRG
jgi:hypothetical protein